MFPDHTVITAQARGWHRLNNGALLQAAEEAAVDLLLTTDQRIRYQQNLSGRKIAIVVLAGTTKWSQVRLHFERIVAVVNGVIPGSYTEVEIPFLRPKNLSRKEYRRSEEKQCGLALTSLVTRRGQARFQGRRCRTEVSH